MKTSNPLFAVGVGFAMLSWKELLLMVRYMMPTTTKEQR
jgi:hypothetical protein